MKPQVLYFAQKGVILNKEKSHLLCFRYLKAKYSPEKLEGKLALPGGRLEFGEQPLDAFQREIREETGLEVTPIIPLYTWTWIIEKEDMHRQIIANAVLAIHTSGEIKEAIPEPELEIEKAQWLPIAQIDLNEFIDDEAPAIKAFLDFLGKNPFATIFQ